MRFSSWRTMLLGLSLAACGAVEVPALRADEPAAKSEVYAPPSPAEARDRVTAWAKSRPTWNADNEAKLAALWAGEQARLAGDDMLDRLVQSITLFDADLARIVQPEHVTLLTPETLVNAARQAGLDDKLTANLRLYAGRAAAEIRLYDEAKELLAPINAADVVDPATLFFQRAVVSQALLDIPDALAQLNSLLHQTQDVPVRYSATAVILEAELAKFEEKSLGEVARLMNDSERRLDLGRAGERVQGVQDQIIANLDELIKKLEQQAGGGGGGGNGGNSNESGSEGAQDSSVKGATAPGETDKKKFSKEAGWGNLPEKSQAEARNMINRNFPPNYGRAIDAYTKKLANRPAK